MMIHNYALMLLCIVQKCGNNSNSVATLPAWLSICSVVHPIHQCHHQCLCLAERGHTEQNMMMGSTEAMHVEQHSHPMQIDNDIEHNHVTDRAPTTLHHYCLRKERWTIFLEKVYNLWVRSLPLSLLPPPLQCLLLCFTNGDIEKVHSSAFKAFEWGKLIATPQQSLGCPSGGQIHKLFLQPIVCPVWKPRIFVHGKGPWWAGLELENIVNCFYSPRAIL